VLRRLRRIDGERDRCTAGLGDGLRFGANREDGDDECGADQPAKDERRRA